MRNQVRAALYLLRRNVWLWVALVLVALQELGILLLAADGTRFGGQDSLFGLFLTPAICCVAAAGVVAADQRERGLRQAATAEGGRLACAASRLVAVLVSTALVVGLTLALDALPGLAGLTDFSVSFSASDMHTPVRLLSGFLACLAYAEVTLVVGMATRRAWAAALVVPLATPYALHAGLLALTFVPADSLVNALAGALVRVAGLLPGGAAFSQTVVFTGAGASLPADYVSLLLVPAVWIAAMWGACLLVMARRTV